MDETKISDNHVIFKIFKLNSNKEHEFFKDYQFTLNMRICDIREKIANELSNDKNNYANLDNITERIYKDFGKLFFEKGLLPMTVDNYKLEQFTNGGRTFTFCVSLITQPKKDVIKKDVSDQNSTLKRLIKEERNIKNKDEGFVFYEDDFPALC